MLCVMHVGTYLWWITCLRFMVAMYEVWETHGSYRVVVDSFQLNLDRIGYFEVFDVPYGVK